LFPPLSLFNSQLIPDLEFSYLSTFWQSKAAGGAGSRMDGGEEGESRKRRRWFRVHRTGGGFEVIFTRLV
jgi:hypothetical protein